MIAWLYHIGYIIMDVPNMQMYNLSFINDVQGWTL